jgi:hypothetical protein
MRTTLDIADDVLQAVKEQFVTFDGKIPLAAVRTARPENLLVL